MGNLIIKPATGLGNSLKIQDQAGQECFSTVDDGGVLTDKVAVEVQGTAVKSTGEAGGTKFLREDGDGTSSWQTVDMTHEPEGTAVKSTGETGATKYLREDGDGTSSWQAVASGGSLVSMQAFTTSGTWTRPAGVSSVIVKVAGGQGGGGCPWAGYNSGYAVQGTAGGASSFGSHCTGNGGVCGIISHSGGGGRWGDGFSGQSQGGTATGGDINYQGGGPWMSNNGWCGYSNEWGEDSASGGAGGLAIKFIAAPGATETITVGAGGSGSTQTAGNNDSAIDGLPGYVIVEEYS